MKKKQIPTERKQIRYTTPPRAPPEPRKTKEEDDRLTESQQGTRCGAASDQIRAGGTERKPTREERRLAGHHTSTHCWSLTGFDGQAMETKEGSSPREGPLIKAADFTGSGSARGGFTLPREPAVAATNHPEIAREEPRTAML